MSPEEAFNAIRQRVIEKRINDTLAELDWHTYQCQCPQHTGPRGCREPARYILHIHAINRCNQPGLDPFGNRIEIRCRACLKRFKAHVAYQLWKLNRWGPNACETCGAPITRLSDVLREVVKL